MTQNNIWNKMGLHCSEMIDNSIFVNAIFMINSIKERVVNYNCPKPNCFRIISRIVSMKKVIAKCLSSDYDKELY